MTTLWGLHMPEDIGPDALEGGYVVVGWAELGDIAALPNDREAIKRALIHAYPNRKPGAIPVEAGMILRYLHEVRIGDVVVYPSKHDRQVNIGRITGPVVHYPGPEDDADSYPNRRAVEWLGHFPRSEFSQSALYEIGAFITLFRIKNHPTEFLAKIDPTVIVPDRVGEETEAPDDDSVAGTVSRQAEETTEDYVIRKIYSELSGYEFEHLVAHLLECMGYTARVSEKSGDGGVDVIAHTDELGFEPPIIKVQCKRKTDQTGEPEVSQLLGTLGEGECALFVNLGSYSKPARVLERNRPKLRLIDGEQFVKLMLENYDKLSARYRTMMPLKRIYVPDV
ncbi:restriction endonuclease [uncultured Roseibium sp.]|uniref:restriction endonuclease n=1 Tax=uncultured Roseibium sp. TaxID=1936171 RepID=UPI003216515D